jgi:hypothetical protein
MIICVCRNIKESDYQSQEELIERIMQTDHQCGQCQEYCQKFLDLQQQIFD